MTVTPAAISALASGDISNFFVASTPGGIEAQEARGQRDLVSNFNKLPRSMDADERETAIKLGFVIGEPIDEVFVSVMPPEGWELRPTEHSMHSDILDAKGAIRGNMFYKAAFYDRRADVSWNSRFVLRNRYVDDTTEYLVEDKRDDTVVLGPVTFANIPRPTDNDWTAYDAARAEQEVARSAIKAKLVELYPDHADPVAYWND